LPAAADAQCGARGAWGGAIRAKGAEIGGLALIIREC
jgi:hypothetical protein